MSFDIIREDGRSNAQVILDYIKGGDPGHIYTYAELGAALSHGTNRLYDMAAVRQTVASAYPRLLKEQQRALHNIRGTGYRLAEAKDHVGLAMTRKRRADVQLKRGLQTLRNVRWDELDENARRAHEGTLMVTEALWANQSALERRQRAVEDAIAGLAQRVDGLDKKSA